MASFNVFDSFFIIKTSQEWGRTWYNPWQSKIEAKLHEESKFWRASNPLPNQSSVQGRESDEESNTEEFCNHLQNFRKTEEIFTTTFFTCEIFASSFSLAKISHILFLLRNFRNSISDLRNLHVIFRYFSPTPLDFYLKIFCVNYLFSPCN